MVRKAVRLYGEQRGQRMALRAQRDGEPPNMLNYLAYSEWRVEPGAQEQRMEEMAPEAHSFVTRCPWHQAWVDSELLPYGRLYCLEIDHALVRGFNKTLQLDVLSTLSNDGGPCEFVFHEADLTPENLDLLNEKKATNQQKGGVMSWEYHTGHLYSAFQSTLLAELKEGGEAILADALSEFARRYGQEAAQVILSYQGVDFDSINFDEVSDGKSKRSF